MPDAHDSMMASAQTMTAAMNFIPMANQKIKALRDRLARGEQLSDAEMKYLGLIKKVPCLMKLTLVVPPPPLPPPPPAPTIPRAPAVPPSPATPSPSPSVTTLLKANDSMRPALMPMPSAPATKTTNSTLSTTNTPPPPAAQQPPTLTIP
jgi:hypothetical protein